MKHDKMAFSLNIGWAVLCLGIFCSNAHSVDTANYDTAWTFVYDGGKTTNGKVVNDLFRDVKILPNGNAICVGGTVDSTGTGCLLLFELNPIGKVLQKRLYTNRAENRGSSIILAKNGDVIVGGSSFGDPFLLRLDPSFNKKYSTWYTDTVLNKSRLPRSATINAMVETKDGRILAVAGDKFPYNGSLPLNNYAALLRFDSLGAVVLINDWLNTTGYELAGWSLTPSLTGGYMLGGNQSVFTFDDFGVLGGQSNYSFSLPGVGSVLNNVSRVHQLRNGTVMVAGQTYEEDCWKRYQRLYYDAWWSPLSPSGSAGFRYTAGVSGANDIIYDFTQLVDGNIVFVGTKQSFDQIGGIWAIVTDSTGKTIRWQKQVRVPYRSASGAAVDAYSVSASPDSGFTVVGPYVLNDSLGGTNAYAAHFVPKPMPLSIATPSDLNLHNIRMGDNWVFSFTAKQATEAELRLYTVQGQLAGRYTQHRVEAGEGEIRVAAAKLKAGMYLWQLRVGAETTKGLAALAD